MSLSSPGRLLSNTVWNVAGRIVAVGVSIALTSYLLDRLGTERFGLWALANLLVGYFSLADLGIQAGLIRQIAFCRPDENPEQFSKIVSTTFFVFFGAFVLTLPLAALFTPNPAAILSIFGREIDAALGEEAGLVVTIAIGAVFLSIAFAALASILPGIQRMDLSNKLGALSALAMFFGAVCVIENGRGVPDLLLVSVATRALQGVASYHLARRLFPRFRLLESFVDWAVWKELYRFGWRVQVSRLCELGIFTFDRLFLGAAAGLAALGRYQPAVQVATQGRMLPFLLVSAFLPYTSELSAAGQTEKLRKTYFEGTLYLSFTAFALLSYLIAFAPWLTIAWLGGGFDDVALWVRLFCIGYLVNVPLSLGGLLSQAIGRPGIQARSALIGALLNLALAPLGYYIGGITGLTVGASAAVVAASVWFAWALHRAMKVSNREFLRDAIRAPLACWAPPLLVGLAASSQLPGPGRALAFGLLTGVGALWAGYGWVFARRLELLDVRARLDRLEAME